jgi:hypothetical protein
MLKRRLASAAVALGVLTLAAGPAQAYEDGPTFNLRFYTDANHTTQVGFASWRCIPGPHAQLQWGYSTAFEEVDWVGNCVNGQLEL